MQALQLPLSLSLSIDARLQNYYPGRNTLCLNSIRQLLTQNGDGEFFLYLWGPPGVGRTHLLQGACHLASDLGLSAVYVPLKEVIADDPILLEGFENLHLVCIDDIESAIGHPKWQERLFHLFNQLKESEHGHLLISGSSSPQGLGIELQDLRSRLGWGVTYHLIPLNDDDKLLAIKGRAQEKGMHLSDEVGNYLLRHYARSIPQLYALLDKLDRASLAFKRKLTVPFVKEILG